MELKDEKERATEYSEKALHLQVCVLQCVAVCCSVLQCVSQPVVQCVAVCCSLMQCVAVCVALCCSVLP